MGVQLQLDVDGLDALASRINTLAVESGKGVAFAVKWTAWYAGKSAAALTKRARKTRKIRRNTGMVDSRYSKVRYPRYVEIYSQSGDVKNWFFRTAETAKIKASKQAKIKRRGLARSAWNCSISTISSTGEKISDGRKFGKLRLFEAVRDNPQAEIKNTLKYAVDAWKSGREYEVTRRAVRYMDNAIKRQLYKTWR